MGKFQKKADREDPHLQSLEKPQDKETKLQQLRKKLSKGIPAGGIMVGWIYSLLLVMVGMDFQNLYLTIIGTLLVLVFSVQFLKNKKAKLQQLLKIFSKSLAAEWIAFGWVLSILLILYGLINNQDSYFGLFGALGMLVFGVMYLMMYPIAILIEAMKPVKWAFQRRLEIKKIQQDFPVIAQLYFIIVPAFQRQNVPTKLLTLYYYRIMHRLPPTIALDPRYNQVSGREKRYYRKRLLDYTIFTTALKQYLARYPLIGKTLEVGNLSYIKLFLHAAEKEISSSQYQTEKLTQVIFTLNQVYQGEIPLHQVYTRFVNETSISLAYEEFYAQLSRIRTRNWELSTINERTIVSTPQDVTLRFFTDPFFCMLCNQAPTQLETLYECPYCQRYICKSCLPKIYQEKPTKCSYCRKKLNPILLLKKKSIRNYRIARKLLQLALEPAHPEELKLKILEQAFQMISRETQIDHVPISKLFGVYSNLFLDQDAKETTELLPNGGKRIIKTTKYRLKISEYDKHGNPTYSTGKRFQETRSNYISFYQYLVFLIFSDQLKGFIIPNRKPHIPYNSLDSWFTADVFQQAKSVVEKITTYPPPAVCRDTAQVELAILQTCLTHLQKEAKSRQIEIARLYQQYRLKTKTPLDYTTFYEQLQVLLVTQDLKAKISTHQTPSDITDDQLVILADQVPCTLCNHQVSASKLGIVCPNCLSSICTSCWQSLHEIGLQTCPICSVALKAEAYPNS